MVDLPAEVAIALDFASDSRTSLRFALRNAPKGVFEMPLDYNRLNWRSAAPAAQRPITKRFV